MAHAIQGLLLRAEGADALARTWPAAKWISLQADIVWLPLRPEPASEDCGFEYWSDALEAQLIALSLQHAVAYFETEYFGGAGTQNATVFRAGQRVLERGSVNEALGLLGVERGASRDAWDAVGLTQHRRMPGE